jgi:hypothetical protein
MRELVFIVIGALVSYLLPKILDPVFKPKEPVAGVYRFPWLWWILAQTVAGGLGGAFSAALGAQGLNSPGGLANWAAFGACLGIAQWFVLQREARITPLWAVASTLGWSAFAYFQHIHAPGPLGWIFAGLAVGLLQWPILAKRRTRAFWWAPANAAAWFIGGSIGYAAGLGMLQSSMSFASSWVLGWSLVGLIGSSITGFALSRMPKKEAASGLARS